MSSSSYHDDDGVASLPAEEVMRNRCSPIAPPPIVTTTNDDSSSLCGPASLPTLEAVECEDDCSLPRSPATNSGSSKRTFFGLPKRYFAFAVALWLSEVVFVCLMKRFGLVEPEFRPYEAVKQMGVSVLPQHLEQALLSRLNESVPLSYLKEEKKRPGFKLAQQGAQAHYPIVMVPGRS